MAESRAQEYAARLDELTRSAEELTPEAQRRIVLLLDAALREILADLAHRDPASYSAAHLQALKTQVELAMQQFGDQAAAQVQRIEDQAYRQAAKSIDAAVAVGTGTIAVQPVIDQATLRVVQGYTADLITGLTRDAAAKINAAIQRAYIGQATLAQLTAQIGSVLEDGKFSGLFSQVGNRALGIATNEIGRIHSLASFARIRDLKQRHPTLKKGWRHTPVAKVPRITHILANGQTREPEEPFLVGGEDLMYPRDPSGSPGNTINCHCLLYPALSDDDLKPTGRERALLKKYGIAVVPTRS